MYAPLVIRTDLSAPEAIVISTADGAAYVVADHNAPTAMVEAMQLMAEYLPTIPNPRRPHGVG